MGIKTLRGEGTSRRGLGPRGQRFFEEGIRTLKDKGQLEERIRTSRANGLHKENQDVESQKHLGSGIMTLGLM